MVEHFTTDSEIEGSNPVPARHKVKMGDEKYQIFVIHINVDIIILKVFNHLHFLQL